MHVTITLVSFILTAGFTVFFFIRSRHLERMSRIEHGMEESANSNGGKSLFKLGIFFVFLGTGFLSALLGARVLPFSEEALIPGFLLIFGGLGLIVGYILEKKENARR